MEAFSLFLYWHEREVVWFGLVLPVSVGDVHARQWVWGTWGGRKRKDGHRLGRAAECGENFWFSPSAVRHFTQHTYMYVYTRHCGMGPSELPALATQCPQCPQCPPGQAAREGTMDHLQALQERAGRGPGSCRAKLHVGQGMAGQYLEAQQTHTETEVSSVRDWSLLSCN